MTPTSTKPASLPRRLGAIVYDGLLLMAVWVVASALVLLLNRGQPFSPDNPFMTVYIFLVTFFFFAWFWTHGGQTLGMKAWRLKLVSLNGSPVSWGQSMLRFLTAVPAWILLGIGCARMLPASPQLPTILDLLLLPPAEIILGLGLIWVLVDNSRFNWRDRLINSQVIRLEKQSAAAS